jgi:hypothetical protein
MRITIEAGAKSFKTTVARLVAQALMDAGVAVSLEDNGQVLDATSQDPVQETRLAALKDAGVMVEVVTEQVWEPEKYVPPPWSMSRGRAWLVAALHDGTVHGERVFSATEALEANFVAVRVDGEPTVAKCRYGIYAPGTVLTQEHVADIAFAYSALTYASERVFQFNPLDTLECPTFRRYLDFLTQVIAACRILAQESRRARLAGLLAQLL